MDFVIPDAGPTPVSVGGVQFDALLDIIEKYDANVPTLKTDRGYDNSDDIIPNLMKVDMKLFVTPTPVTWKNIPSHFGRNPKEVVDALKELMNERKPVFVTTVKKNYSNMMIQKVTVNKTADIGYALEVDISLVQLTRAPYSHYAMPGNYEVEPSTNVSMVLDVGSEDGEVNWEAFGKSMSGRSF